MARHTTCVVLTDHMKPLSQLRKIKPNPNDPTWTFPYATRERIERLRRFFLTELKPTTQMYWRTKNTHAIPQKKALAMRKRGIRWPSVPRRFVPQVDAYFDQQCQKYIALHGSLPRGVRNSIRMRAANYGRNVLTGKRCGNFGRYMGNKRIWFAFLDWEEHERKMSLPKTPSKILEVV